MWFDCPSVLQNVLSRSNSFDKEQTLLSLDNVVQSVMAQDGERHVIWVNVEVDVVSLTFKDSPRLSLYCTMFSI